MIFLVCSKDCKGFPIDIGIPQSTSLDNSAYVTAFGLQFTFQDTRRTPFGHLGQTL